MTRPVVTVVLTANGGPIHQETRQAFNAGIRASESAVREAARAAGVMFEGDRPSRIGDRYTREWVAADGSATILATVERVA